MTPISMVFLGACLEQLRAFDFKKHEMNGRAAKCFGLLTDYSHVKLVLYI